MLRGRAVEGSTIWISGPQRPTDTTAVGGDSSLPDKSAVVESGRKTAPDRVRRSDATWENVEENVEENEEI